MQRYIFVNLSKVKIPKEKLGEDKRQRVDGLLDKYPRSQGVLLGQGQNKGTLPAGKPGRGD